VNKRVQCAASPIVETKAHCLFPLPDGMTHEICREPNEDAFTCTTCEVTFVGGPIHVVHVSGDQS
jgi:hypothetical protein